MTEFIPCPYYGHTNISIDEIFLRQFVLVCNDCGCVGPEADTPEEAIAKWNERAFIPRGDPTEETEARRV